MPRTTLSKLREIRDAQRRTEALLESRNALICEALAEGHSHRKVALATGLSPGRVHQIQRGR